MSSSSTYVSQAFRPVATGFSIALLRELLAVTPLVIAIQALVAPTKQAQR